MTVFIFSGPTLSAAEGQLELDAVFLPPAAMGDVYRATLDKPQAIGLIDGYFERVPAVWHKEILWAMSEGIHVYGCSSMGALRAAELAQFGMIGVGTIFEAFHTGQLDDDDEVAVAHASVEDNFRPLSEAMVNIRVTLAHAQAAGVVGESSQRLLEQAAKRLFYPDRNYPALLAEAVRAGVPTKEVEALRAWLPQGRINQKRADALAMLRRMREDLATSPRAKQVRYTFEHTDSWEAVRQQASQLRLEGTQRHGPVLQEALLEELRVSGTFTRARHAALARILSLLQANHLGRRVGVEVLQETIDTFRREHGLFQPADFERWMEQQHLVDLERFFHDEAMVRWIETMFETEMLQHLPDYLRTTSEYGPLMERTRLKKQVLTSAGQENPGLEEAKLTETELWNWYFSERLGQPIPTDLASYARTVGFSDERALRRAALREFCFLRLQGIAPTS